MISLSIFLYDSTRFSRRKIDKTRNVCRHILYQLDSLIDSWENLFSSSQIERHSVDAEYIRLLHDIHFDDIQGHLYRGYTIVGSKTAEHPTREIENYLGSARPIWFVFSGMGSQWPGMGMYYVNFVSDNKNESDYILP